MSLYVRLQVVRGLDDEARMDEPGDVVLASRLFFICGVPEEGRDPQAAKEDFLGLVAEAAKALLPLQVCKGQTVAGRVEAKGPAKRGA